MRPHLGRADGALENAGDFGERELLETRQQEHFAIIAVEARECRLQQGVIVARRGVMRRVGRIVHMLLQIHGVGGMRRGVRLAKMIRGTAARQVVHPGGEAAIIPVRVTVLQHALEDRLRDVLGRRPVSRQLDEEAEERPVMALEQLAQRVQLAVPDGEHQGVVRTWFDGGVHGDGIGGFNHGEIAAREWFRGGWGLDFVDGGNHGSGTWLMLPSEPGGTAEVTSFLGGKAASPGPPEPASAIARGLVCVRSWKSGRSPLNFLA